MSKPTAKPLSKNQIAIRLAKELRVGKRTAYEWFELGCPCDSFEDALEWAKNRPSRKKKEPEPTPEPFTDSGFDTRATIDALIESHPQQIETIVEMRSAGIPQSRICACTGWSQGLVARVIRGHPQTKELERSNALADWRDVRHLAAGRLKEILQDPTQKLKLGELGVLFGIAHDKLESAEAPPAVNLNIRAKIEGMTYEQLISAIRGATEDLPQIIEGEVEPLPNPRPIPNLLAPGLVHPEGGHGENENGSQQQDGGHNSETSTHPDPRSAPEIEVAPHRKRGFNNGVITSDNTSCR
jgi:hypothetical protein